jgi:hypothetical protein
MVALYYGRAGRARAADHTPHKGRYNLHTEVINPAGGIDDAEAGEL